MSSGVEFVVYTAKWCPVSSRVVKALKEGNRVREVDVDKSFAEAEGARVVSVPTVVAFVDGVEKKRLSGVGALEAGVWVDGFLKRRGQRSK